MNFAAYRALPAMNWSRLKDIHTSPKLFKYREDHPRPDTPALSNGRLIHMAVLEPERFAAECVIRPPGIDLRNKEGKAWKASLEGRSIVDQAVLDCADAVLTDPEASALLAGCKTEVTAEWVDQLTGVSCKARLDAAKSVAFIDLKSCRGLKQFHRDAENMLYHGQVAWYHDGAIAAGLIEPDADAYLIAVESSEPFDVMVIRATRGTLDKGRCLCRSLLGLWQQCDETGLWPGMSPTTTDWELSAYAAGSYSKLEDLG